MLALEFAMDALYRTSQQGRSCGFKKAAEVEVPARVAHKIFKPIVWRRHALRSVG